MGWDGEGGDVGVRIGLGDVLENRLLAGSFL
jgi:hypothetical protein